MKLPAHIHIKEFKLYIHKISLKNKSLNTQCFQFVSNIFFKNYNFRHKKNKKRRRVAINFNMNMNPNETLINQNLIDKEKHDVPRQKSPQYIIMKYCIKKKKHKHASCFTQAKSKQIEVLICHNERLSSVCPVDKQARVKLVFCIKSSPVTITKWHVW